MLAAQDIDPARGVDPRVDYVALARLAPWDDRNYQLRLEDVQLLADDHERGEPLVPLFYRVILRKAAPELSRPGVLYPRSALQKFKLLYGGFLQDGEFYDTLERRDGRIRVRRLRGAPGEQGRPARGKTEAPAEARVTTPTGAAESAVAINPIYPDTVIAGTNGPGPGQKMHYSTDGGVTWNAGAPLPGPSSCCDPTVGWSSDGTLAYAASLGGLTSLIFYRSDDYGLTWDGLENETPGQPVRTMGGLVTDKEYLHVDRYPGSPHLDNVYLTWHEGNVMFFARSTDFGVSWSTPLSLSSGPTQSGIGSDITTGKDGHIYYVWPATSSQRIILRKSTDGGASFGAVTEIADTEARFIFPIPSTDLRQVFIYVSADTDLSAGPYGGSVYAAWTDATASEQIDPEDNHARIQVAYSRDGGDTWAVTTPHETADADTVDRWHQWLAVAPNGDVHVVFYDTRNAPDRESVDLYHSFSTDGAQTWSTPARVSSESSPKISDSFEFGDYNGMDVVLNKLVSVWTDNRDETASTNESVDVYSDAVDEPVGVTLAARVFLEGAYGAGPGTMVTELNDGDLIPVDQPYANVKYESTELAYPGTETGVAVDTSGVDWVRISLRSGTDSASTVATRAALLLEDGSITEVDGSRAVAFPGAPQTGLYVVVDHRNHIPVMSAAPVDFSSGGAAYDFTTSMSQAYSVDRDPMVDLGAGAFGMIAGDGNQDGQVTAIDFNLWLVATKTAVTGYVDEDYSLDTNVTASDFNFFLVNTKLAPQSQVPD